MTNCFTIFFATVSAKTPSKKAEVTLLISIPIKIWGQGHVINLAEEAASVNFDHGVYHFNQM